jgi:dTDP-4-dehydrorhamnose 3,5-epimerase
MSNSTIWCFGLPEIYLGQVSRGKDVDWTERMPMSTPIRLVGQQLDGVFRVERMVHRDARGHFSELWNEAQFREAGWDGLFRQDCLSRSQRGVLRGLHIQEPAQAKLVTLLEGRTLHVAVDLRSESPTFRHHEFVELQAEEPSSLLIAEGFAHGFLALEDSLVHYKCSELHEPSSEWSIAWNDAGLSIPWPWKGEPVVSPRDQQGLSLERYLSIRAESSETVGKPA